MTSILAVTSEAFPLAKSGGLGDAVSGMALALREAGMDVTIMLPAHAGVLERVAGAREISRLPDLPGGPATLLSGVCRGLDVPLLLFRNDSLYEREGLYADAQGREYSDNALRFAALSHAAARAAAGTPRTAPADIVHLHDWHTALVPLLLEAREGRRPRSVLTLHNLAFQGAFPKESAPALGLSPHVLDGVLDGERINFLKAGIRHADRITTVSRTYAREILTPRFGCGLETLLQARRADLAAIPNGIDDGLWDPARDPHLGGKNFHRGDLGNKTACKALLQRAFGLEPDPGATLVALGSRITTQKMADLAVEALPLALQAHPDLQVAAIGRGDRPLEQALLGVAESHPGRCGVRIGFDEAEAHRLHAGADLLLHGSRFEPFGLTPLYAMRYGTVPIGSRVGGMADTIADPGPWAGEEAMRQASGLLFEGETCAAMLAAIDRAMALRRRPAVWRAIQRNAMAADFSWRRAAPAYAALFRSLLPAPERQQAPARSAAVQALAAAASVARMRPGLAAHRTRELGPAELPAGGPRPAAA